MKTKIAQSPESAKEMEEEQICSEPVEVTDLEPKSESIPIPKLVSVPIQIPSQLPDSRPNSPPTEPESRRVYTKEDLKYNLAAVRFISWFKMSSLGLKPGGLKWQPCPSHWAYRMWCVMGQLRMTLLVVSTAHFIHTKDTSQELHRMLLMLCACTTILPIVYNTMWIVPRYALVSCGLINAILQYLEIENVPEKPSDRKMVKKSCFRSPKELIIIFFPFLVLPIMGTIPSLIIADPQLPLLLAPIFRLQIPDSNFQWPYQLLYGFLVAVDMAFMGFICAGVFLVIPIFLAMHRLEEETRIIIKQLQARWDGNFEEIEEALKGLRLMALWTQYFNISQSTIVYNTKVAALAATILGGFGVIELIDKDVAYAGLLGLTFFEGLVIYNLCFGKAYRIPETVDELKREIWGKGTEMGVPVVRKYVEKSLMAVPWLGVRDGVYKMDRLTCPSFLDFSLKEVTSLVLSY